MLRLFLTQGYLAQKITPLYLKQGYLAHKKHPP